MTGKRKVLLSALVLAAAGSVAGFGAYSAFTATTANSGNTFASGTVAIGDNDSGSAMYSLSNQKPGSLATKCITVTYTGSLNANVRFYTTDTIGSLGTYIDLTITPGSFPGSPPASMACTGFTADSGGALFSGHTLKYFGDTYNSYANGLADYPGSGSSWATNNTVVYKFDLTLQDNDSAQGLSTGSHAFTWEARNQ